MARPARSAGNGANLGRAGTKRTVLLQAMHQGPALRRHLHQHKEDLQNAAGVRVLNFLPSFTGLDGRILRCLQLKATPFATLSIED